MNLKKMYVNLFFHIHVGGQGKKSEIVIEMEILIRKVSKKESNY